MPYEYFAEVHRVVDGDTAELTIDLGFDICLGPKLVRFHGINAPEIHDTDPAIKAKAQAAVDFVVSKLLPPDPKLTPKVKIQTEKPDSTDKYGRLLGRVLYLPPELSNKKSKTKKSNATSAPIWIDLGEEMLSLGLVKPYDGTGVKPV